MLEGFLSINKPIGRSSFSIVGWIKKLSQQKRVGHSGTLDPFASGVLVLGLGRLFTRQMMTIQQMPKTYVVSILLGKETDTQDITGTVTNSIPHVSLPSDSVLESVINKYIGDITQIPPSYSAKKINGKRAYLLARAGKVVEMAPTFVSIYAIDVLDKTYNELGPLITLRVSCSKGTYIRTLAKDIGQSLGTLGVAFALTREAVGYFDSHHALSTIDIDKEKISEQLRKDTVLYL